MSIKQIFKVIRLISFSSLILFNLSCEKENPEMAGERTKVTRLMDAFTTIDVYDCFDVYLKSDTINKIEIEAGNKLIPNIETTISNGNLSIKDKNKFKFVKGYDKMKLYISVDTIKYITVQDASNLYTIDTLRAGDLSILFLSDVGSCNLTVNTENVYLDIWYGSGDYTLNGKSHFARLNADALSFIYAEGLETISCYVVNNSMGDCYVKSNSSLGIEINDSGNIYYSGNPAFLNIASHKGSGKLIKK